MPWPGLTWSPVMLFGVCVVCACMDGRTSACMAIGPSVRPSVCLIIWVTAKGLGFNPVQGLRFPSIQGSWRLRVRVFEGFRLGVSS